MSIVEVLVEKGADVRMKDNDDVSLIKIMINAAS